MDKKLVLGFNLLCIWFEGRRVPQLEMRMATAVRETPLSHLSSNFHFVSYMLPPGANNADRRLAQDTIRSDTILAVRVCPRPSHNLLPLVNF